MLKSAYSLFLVFFIFFSCSSREEKGLRAKLSEDNYEVQKDTRKLSNIQISQYKDFELASNKKFVIELKALVDSSFEKQLDVFKDEELGVIAGYKYMFKYLFMSDDEWIDLQIQLGDRYFNSLNTEQQALQLSMSHSQKVKELRTKYKGSISSTTLQLQVLNLPNSKVYFGGLDKHSRNNVAIEIGTTILDVLLGILITWIIVNIIGYAVTGPVGCLVSILSFIIMMIVSVLFTNFNDNKLLESLRQQKTDYQINYDQILKDLDDNTIHFYETNK